MFVLVGLFLPKSHKLNLTTNNVNSVITDLRLL